MCQILESGLKDQIVRKMDGVPALMNLMSYRWIEILITLVQDKYEMAKVTYDS